MLKKNKTSTRQAAKEAGLMDNLILCRKHLAMFFGLAVNIFTQAVPALLNLLDSFSACDGQTAPANAAGIFRLALSAGELSPDFSKSMRRLTKHKKIFISDL